MIKNSGMSVDTVSKGGADMATSSIFHNVKIDCPEKAEAFVAALEASINDPWVREGEKKHKVVTDPATIRMIMKKNKESRESIR